MLQVRFKHKKAEFMLAYDCPRDIAIGDLVKVEADRGTDIGEVDAVLPILSPSGIGLSRLGIPIRKILGRASAGEAAFIVSKSRDELGALQVCRDMVARRGMEIQVLDAEFQFDRKKLTFIFTSDK
jgi:cell fate regulator YaaT (PSP1 superfamily)